MWATGPEPGVMWAIGPGPGPMWANGPGPMWAIGPGPGPIWAIGPGPSARPASTRSQELPMDYKSFHRTTRASTRIQELPPDCKSFHQTTRVSTRLQQKTPPEDSLRKKVAEGHLQKILDLHPITGASTRIQKFLSDCKSFLPTTRGQRPEARAQSLRKASKTQGKPMLPSKSRGTP